MQVFDVFENPLGMDVTQEDSANNNPELLETFNTIMDIASLFSTDQGKRVLKMWRENTIERAAWSPSMARQCGLDAANAHAYAREGQNAFIRDIEEKIKLAELIREPKDLLNLKGN